VIDGFGVDRLDNRNFVNHFGDVRQHFADVRAVLPVFLELEHRRDTWERLLARRHPSDPLAHSYRGWQLLAVNLTQRRLVVERVDVRRAARHKQIDHAFGLRRKVRQPRQSLLRRSGDLWNSQCRCALARQQRQRSSAQRTRAIGQQLTSIELLLEFF
jgi:hypothetical protein